MHDEYFPHTHARRGRRGRSPRADWSGGWSGRPGPWGEADEDRISLRRSAAALFGAVRQLRTASPEERSEAKGILDDARRRLYLLFARDGGPSADVSSDDTPDATAV